MATALRDPATGTQGRIDQSGLIYARVELTPRQWLVAFAILAGTAFLHWAIRR